MNLTGNRVAGGRYSVMENAAANVNTTISAVTSTILTTTLGNDTEEGITCKNEMPYIPQDSSLHDFAREYAKYHGHLSAIVCVFGLLANLANIVVLTRKNMHSSINMILTWLAVADLCTMLSYFPVAVHFYILKDPNLDVLKTRNYNWIEFLMFHSSFTIVCHTIAIWLTIVLAIFRYIYMSYPTRGPQLCNPQRAKIAIFLVYLGTVITCIPNYLTNGIQRYCDTLLLLVEKSDENTTAASPNSIVNRTVNVTQFIFGIDVSSFATNYPIIMNVNYWTQAVLIKLIPCTLLTILTILLIMIIHKANKRRMKLMSEGRRDESERHREHNRTTIMLLAVVVLFLITELPQGILTVLNSVIDNFFMNVYSPLGDILDITALINNSVNFVLYCSMSKQFRDTFLNTFFHWCPNHRPGWLKLQVVRVTTANGNGNSIRKNSHTMTTTTATMV